MIRINMEKVKIYTSSTCHWCMKAKEFFKQHKVEYEELNCSENPTYRDEVIKKTGQRGVPVIEIGKKIIIGYDEDELRSALKL